nr:MAG TPA: PORTAL PROTEIN [Caudoviricetes sp.]
MTPFLEMRRSLAAEFSAASCVPISSLGIVQDNPSSAEAIYASKEDLVIEATALNRANGYSLDRVVQNMVLLRDGGSAYDMDDELARVSTRWRNPAMPSVVSQSDAMVKQISAIPELAQTDVALEELGYTAEQIIRIRSQIRRAQAAGVLDKLLADRTPAEELTPGEEPEDDQDPDTPEDEDPDEAEDERDGQDQDDEDERGRRRRRRRRRRVRGDDDDEAGH